MITELKPWLALFALTIAVLNGHAEDCARTGAQAELSTFFHQVSGTATIISSNAIQVDRFSYDGGGPAVYFYLGTNNTQQAFIHGIPIGGLLTGQSFSNDTVTVTLPPGGNLDGYNAISVWCVDFSANFGSANFQPYIDEISTTESPVQISVSGAPGEVYRLLGSTNGISWLNLATGTNVTGNVLFADTNSLQSRLYRAEVE